MESLFKHFSLDVLPVIYGWIIHSLIAGIALLYPIISVLEKYNILSSRKSLKIKRSLVGIYYLLGLAIILATILFILSILVNLTISAWTTSILESYIESFNYRLFNFYLSITFLLAMLCETRLWIKGLFWKNILSKECDSIDKDVLNNVIYQIKSKKMLNDLMFIIFRWTPRIIDFVLVSVFFILLRYLVPELKAYVDSIKSFIEAYFYGFFGGLSLEIGNLAIIFFTLALLTIEYIRYRQEFSLPVTTVTLEAFRFKSEEGIVLVFKAAFMNFSKIAYSVGGDIHLIDKELIKESERINFMVKPPLFSHPTFIENLVSSAENAKKKERLIIAPQSGSEAYIRIREEHDSSQKYTFIIFSFRFEKLGLKLWEPITLTPKSQTSIDYLYVLDHSEMRVKTVLKI